MKGFTSENSLQNISIPFTIETGFGDLYGNKTAI